MNLTNIEVLELDKISDALAVSVAGSDAGKLDEVQVDAGCGGCSGTQISCSVPTRDVRTSAKG